MTLDEYYSVRPMIRYLLKRLLLFIPTLIVISLLAFGLSKLAPGDPVGHFLQPDQGVGDPRRYHDQYEEVARSLGLDKPAFYFKITSAAYPDTLHRIKKKDQRENLSKLIAQYGNWPDIEEYYRLLNAFDLKLSALPDSLKKSLGRTRPALRDLYLAYRDKPIRSRFEQMGAVIYKDTALEREAGPLLSDAAAAYDQIQRGATRAKLYIPKLIWYGFDNQYHHWLTAFFKGDFGVSYKDRRPAGKKIREALKWTLVLNGLAILLAYLISVPVGVYCAVHKDSFFDRSITLLLFVLYSLPTFWIATLLLIFITTPEYGMDWFPSFELGDLPPEAPFWDRFRETAYHMVLPVFCLTYGSLAFVSRQMRGGMLNVIRQDYIRTARAKGLPENKVIWKHAFRNSLFPVITLFASVFPAAIAGSVVIEVIFSIPGMGRLTIDSIYARDWPVVYAILMLAAILTMIGIMVADFLYALADPRVTYDKGRG